eukprot:COSAG05_NODE_579_length_8556_cov_44.773679_4_plen_59_part_00
MRAHLFCICREISVVHGFAEKEAAAAAWKESCTPPLELVVQSRWPGAVVDWGDTEPLL